MSDERGSAPEVRWLLDDGVMCIGRCGTRLKFVTYTSPDAMWFHTKEEAEGAILTFGSRLGGHPLRALDHRFMGPTQGAQEECNFCNKKHPEETACIQSQHAQPVETSKPADLLNMCDCDRDIAAPHSKDCQLTKWQMAHGGGEFGAMGMPTRWEGGWPSDVEFLTPQQAAALLNRKISEVERLTKERDAEIREWQDAIYKVCVKAAVEAGFPDHTIDGGGSDGDELTFTLAEIEQAINCVQEAAESKLSQFQLANDLVVSLDDFKMARQWMLGAKCVCGKRKGWMHGFCDGCYSKLAPEAKSNIYRMFRRKFVKLYVEILREKLASREM